MKFRNWELCLAAFACWSGTAIAQTAVVENLGTWGPEWTVRPSAVSADGKVVVGAASTDDFDTDSTAFVWKADSGLVDLMIPKSRANSVSADGSVIVGHTFVESPWIVNDFRAFRRDAQGNVQMLPPLGAGEYSSAYGISNDGATIVGVSHSSPTTRAVRWQNGVPADLGSLAAEPGQTSWASAVSGDGSIAVGDSDINDWWDSPSVACVYRGPGQPVQPLGTLEDEEGNDGENSSAKDVSADGGVVVGYSELPNLSNHAFVWTAAEGMVDLGTVGGGEYDWSYAYAVSADGSLVGGESDNDGLAGGTAAIWVDRQPRQLFEYLKTEHGKTAVGWEFEKIADISADGRTLVGEGTFQGVQAAFRISLSERVNRAPTVTAPAPTTVECSGEQNLVTLTATVNDSDASDRLTVTWSVAGAVVQTDEGVGPGAVSSFTFDFAHGTTPVTVRVTDGLAGAEANTSVTVNDTKDPVVIAASNLTTKVDRGETYATVHLPLPNVTDVCDAAPTVTNNAPANRRFRIGTTNVVWTVTDDSGNLATAVQKVVVLNGKPKAVAGNNVVKKTKQQSVRIRLNGNRSKDPDGHTLSFRWTAEGAKIANPKSASTFATFEIGRTKVALTVTDEAGARSTDSVIVNVKKVRQVRTGARAADGALRESYRRATASNAAGRDSAAVAYVLGVLAGDDVDADGTASTAERLDYLALRDLQSRYAISAGRLAYESFLAGADFRALEASLLAYSASKYAELDLQTGETIEVVVAEIE
jgi:probable HAF family extracellular repeat protein